MRSVGAQSDSFFRRSRTARFPKLGASMSEKTWSAASNQLRSLSWQSCRLCGATSAAFAETSAHPVRRCNTTKARRALKLLQWIASLPASDHAGGTSVRSSACIERTDSTTEALGLLVSALTAQGMSPGFLGINFGASKKSSNLYKRPPAWRLLFTSALQFCLKASRASPPTIGTVLPSPPVNLDGHTVS
ncbi:hypothetical protein EMIHUDRAFT_256706 [Emiliania huxleyi CCMP1516]|uniref:Uncharacterized protein n=2 Tax=Emiliania huxleyi TaxID=2903 RepID=A0A0D3IRR3_EMIH1|nr:hypothetical protein EMIHUDRAFT_256706 [Emiliania huxleyi CCMP1516]EOD13948.1 hypothetical protein EMIHUDRAFT_256706 [Emiliania huxleyi CCMP1516]|eukprot:XP_005766377.1 hypothetical protein EMIHUDRAFT_256706 [Emiliania huxleyi CCMP1516]